MTAENGTTAELVADYQQSVGALYTRLNEQKATAFRIMQEILPDTLASTADLEATFDGSAWEAVHSVSSDSSNFLQRFFEILKRNAAGIRRARTTAGPVFSLSDFCILKAANSLPESARDLWEQQWQLSVDAREELAMTMRQLQESFTEYSRNSTLHHCWASLLLQEATADNCGDLPETEVERCCREAELDRAAISFRSFHQLKQKGHQADQLSQLVQRYQAEGSVQLYNVIYDNAAIVEVADEYRCYMADPDSYCSGQAVIHCDFIEMILENALEATVMELPEGAELPAVYGSYIMAEFDYFILQAERETESAVL